MEFSPMLVYYDRVMHAESKECLYDTEKEIKMAILEKKFSDEKDIMTLNLAIQLRYMHFKFEELKSTSGPTIIISGNPSEDLFSEALAAAFDGYVEDEPEFPPPIPEEERDYEQEQLDQYKEAELDEVRNGNVIPMKGFGKKE